MTKTILLDGDIYLHRAVRAASSSIDWGDGDQIWKVNLPQAKAWFRREFQRLRERLGAKDILVAVGDRNRNFRKELDPSYKHHRKSHPRPLGFTSLEKALEEKTRLVRYPRLEGDDVLGILATRLEDSIIVSIDKDLLSVPGIHYNPDTDTLQTVDEETARVFHLTQTLTGDQVDGYPGCPKIGKVRAAAILADDPTWAAVVAAYAKQGLDEERALLQARLAFVLRDGYYDPAGAKVRLWAPSL